MADSSDAQSPLTLTTLPFTPAYRAFVPHPTGFRWLARSMEAETRDRDARLGDLQITAQMHDTIQGE